MTSLRWSCTSSRSSAFVLLALMACRSSSDTNPAFSPQSRHPDQIGELSLGSAHSENGGLLGGTSGVFLSDHPAAWTVSFSIAIPNGADRDDAVSRIEVELTTKSGAALDLRQKSSREGFGRMWGCFLELAFEFEKAVRREDLARVTIRRGGYETHFEL